MIHPDTTLRHTNDPRGYGVFATAFIPKGTIVYVVDPLEIVLPPYSPLLEHPVLKPIIDKYATVDADGTRMISWDIAKYMNHCCHANTMSTGFGFEIAVRDIAAGEEITDEYGMFNYHPYMPLVCRFADCRQCLRPDDLERHHEQWDAAIKDAMTHTLKLPQPLFQVMDQQTYQDLLYYLQTGSGFNSVACYLQQPTVSETVYFEAVT